MKSAPVSIRYAACSTISFAWYSSIAESAIIHWMPCFSASSEPCAKRFERALDHHVERDLGLADPAHAVREPRRAEPRLAEQVALAAPAEHVVRSARAGP